MAPRFWLTRPAAGFEQTFLLLLIGAVAAAALLVAIVPMPVHPIARIAVVAGIVAADGALFTALWRRQWRIHLTQIDERLARAEAELAESERLASVGRVAAGIAHEIGNPLTGIANYTHILRARAAATPEAETALGGIEHEIDRIERIVRSLLDYARPKKGPPTPFDAGSTLREAVDLLAAQGVFRRVQVETLIEDAPLGLVGNAHEIEQVFVNLLLNAIEAMQTDGRLALYAGRLAPETLLRAPPRRSGDAAGASTERRLNPRLAEWRARRKITEPCAKFVIADSGPGIQGEETDRIFEPFYTTKGEAEGSGLGLAIVQRVVDSHDGVVWVQRAREGGAAFHMVLPLGSLSSAPHQVS